MTETTMEQLDAEENELCARLLVNHYAEAVAFDRLAMTLGDPAAYAAAQAELTDDERREEEERLKEAARVKRQSGAERVIPAPGTKQDEEYVREWDGDIL